MRAETGAQVALENGGGIRASIEPGDVTLGDVLTVLPLATWSARSGSAGRIFRQFWRTGVSKVEEGAGRFLQVSGLRYQFDLSSRQAAGL